jgi:large subunit ribosomal protein L23
MLKPHDIIIKPIITEQTMSLMEDNKYAFYVDKRANKVEIKKAIQEIFDVKVDKVRTLNTKGKLRRMGRYQGYTPNRKKAYVTLREGDKIELFDEL